jgi:hypothetical protein
VAQLTSLGRRVRRRPVQASVILDPSVFAPGGSPSTTADPAVISPAPNSRAGGVSHAAGTGVRAGQRRRRRRELAQRQQTMNGPLKLRDQLLKLTTMPDTNARGHARLVDIQRARALNDPLHHQLPSIEIDHRSPPAGGSHYKRRCSSCSWQQSGVPAKAPTPDSGTGSTSTKETSASARGPRIISDHPPPRHPRNTNFIPREWRSPAITTLG